MRWLLLFCLLPRQPSNDCLTLRGEKMYRIMVKDKPKDCANCPLKGMQTRDCGQIEKVRATSGAIFWKKKPDKRCKIKQV